MKVISFVALIALSATVACCVAAQSRDAIGKLDQKCTVENYRGVELSPPCRKAEGFVVIKACQGPTQFLLMPMKPISGVEAAALQDPNEANYFAQAWDNRHLVEEEREKKQLGGRGGLENIGLDVNSRPFRSQDQLHIHIDYLRNGILGELSAHDDGEWFPVPSIGRTYEAKRVGLREFRETSPFIMIAKRLGALGAKPPIMASENIIVVPGGPIGARLTVYLIHGISPSGETVMIDHSGPCIEQ